jgi:hypothetical protein
MALICTLPIGVYFAISNMVISFCGGPGLGGASGVCGYLTVPGVTPVSLVQFLGDTPGTAMVREGHKCGHSNLGLARRGDPTVRPTVSMFLWLLPLTAVPVSHSSSDQLHVSPYLCQGLVHPCWEASFPCLATWEREASGWPYSYLCANLEDTSCFFKSLIFFL